MKASMISLAALLALGVGTTGIAADGSANRADAPEAIEGQADAEREAALKQRERICLQQTGTRIKHRGRADQERCMAGRSYDQDDLRSTGETNVGQALRRLDPSIY